MKPSAMTMRRITARTGTVVQANGMHRSLVHRGRAHTQRARGWREMDDDFQLVLASASPRRRQLLDQIGVRYLCSPVDIDEAKLDTETPAQYVTRLAAEKSLLGQQANKTNLPVLGADTAVVLDGEVLGKPQGRQHALAMLSRLSGQRHQVFSAVSVRTHDHWQALSVSAVHFRSISREERLTYWASGEPEDKAGAYGIQGFGALFVTHMEGSFSGIVGLPLYETASLLRKAGINVLTSELE